MKPRTMTFAVLASAGILGVTSANAATCESLAALVLPNTTITLAHTVAAGTFNPPGATAGDYRL